MTSIQRWHLELKGVPYSNISLLNTVDINLPREPSEDDSKRCWVIYIHGGAWRDPDIDSSSFTAIQKCLAGSPVHERIAGYASINYRLSPYTSHSSNPSDLSDPARNAKHPDHISDVLTAIHYLQQTYHIHDRYILAGHSCGATLAFQVAMSRFWSEKGESAPSETTKVEPPIAIVGLEGLFDLPALIKYHRDQPVYEEFIRNAFGPIDLLTVSPISGEYNQSWPNGKLVILAHSHRDSLVEWQQLNLQEEVLKAQGWNEGGDRSCRVFELKGDHDEVWQTGDAARAIALAVDILTGR